MKIREMSDVHNEFGVLKMETSAEDKERILILAGDIDAAQHLEANFHWINSKAFDFKHVIYIPGNHEFYHGNFDAVTNFYKNAPWEPNVHFLDHESIELDGVVFWCGTLWTGLAKGDWAICNRVRQGMNDFRLITRDVDHKTAKRTNGLFVPLDMIEIYEENKPKMFEAVRVAKEAGKKTVVVSHHAPCSPSIARHFRGSDMNDAYCMYIDEEVMDKGPDLWFHGHTHASSDYKIGNTRVICNPRGYDKYEENFEFDQHLVVTL